LAAKEVNMRDEAWGEFEQAFFAEGDAYGNAGNASGTDAPNDDFGDLDFTSEPTSARPAWLTAVSGRLAAFRASAARWVRWHARLAEFRVAVAVSAHAEHALRVAAAHRFRPLLQHRRPWLVRASAFILISSAVNYSAAAVMAATTIF
jgi:hypothetical protein